MTFASKNSLSFSWNKYQHCNNESIQVLYEFELLRLADSDIIQSGSELKTDIVFTNLNADTRYRMRVRVSTVSSSGTNRLGIWSSTIADTASAKVTTKPTTSTPAGRSSLAYTTTQSLKETKSTTEDSINSM